jgi:hypothetical protein
MMEDWEGKEENTIGKPYTSVGAMSIDCGFSTKLGRNSPLTVILYFIDD